MAAANVTAAYSNLSDVDAAAETAAAPRPEALPSLDALDGLRGVGAVCIAVYHFLLLFTPAPDNLSTYPLYAPELGSIVTLFFVISGFTLAYVYHDAPRAAPLAFMRRRAARLAPLYYASLLVALPTFYLYTPSAATQAAVAVTTLLGLQALVLPLVLPHLPPAASSWWNAPLWQVSASALLYLVLPAALARLKTWSTRGLRTAIVALTVLDTAAVAAGLALTAGVDLLHMWPPFRAPQFLVGVCAGILAHRGGLTAHAARTADAVTLALAVSALVVCPVASRLAPKALGLPTWHLYIGVVEFLVAPVHALWLLALTSPSGVAGLTRHVLSSRPSRFLGDISYAVYCLHIPVMYFAAWAVVGEGVTQAALPERKEPNTGAVAPFFFAPWAVVPLLAVVIVTATVAHFAIEKPCRALMNARWA